ncbi:MAG: hypothetical protein ACI8PG_001493 [Planctomycetota bacterium]|jgi:hypothetical protein
MNRSPNPSIDALCELPFIPLVWCVSFFLFMMRDRRDTNYKGHRQLQGAILAAAQAGVGALDGQISLRKIESGQVRNIVAIFRRK